MDYENEILGLRAETAAIQVLLVGLLKSLAAKGGGDIIVKEAFGYAEHISEIIALKLGSPATAEHIAAVAKMLEQFRAAVLDDHSKPKDGV